MRSHLQSLIHSSDRVATLFRTTPSYNRGLMSAGRRFRRWVRLSRNPSGMLAMVAVASALTFGWAGWEMLRQEGAAEEQRERERLENRADRVVQTIERVLGD